MADTTTTPIDSGQTTDHTYVGPTPGSGQYGIYQAQAQAAFDSANRQIGTQRTAFLGDMGLTGEYDATHAFDGHTNVDPNGHGAYQQMNIANAGQGASDAAAIQATHLGGGLGRQMQEQAQSNYSALATKYASGVQNQLDSFEQQGVNNQDTFTNGLFSGLQTSIENAIQAGTYNPADYSGISINGTAFAPPPGAAPPPGGTGSTPGVYNGGGGGGAGTPAQTWTVGGKTVYGWGLGGQPFYNKAAAVAAGRLGKKGK